MKYQKKKQLLKINFLCGILLLSTGILLEITAGITTTFHRKNNGFNLNLVEINKVYDNTESSDVDKLEYQTNVSWGWPTSLNYSITSSYHGGHPAIDIVTHDGDYNIYSASSGTVVTNSYKWDGGNYLIVKQDNGYYVLYCHLQSKSPILEGEKVNKGQVIGTMGRTGLATGVHLHFSIWNGYPYHGASSINPFTFY